MSGINPDDKANIEAIYRIFKKHDRDEENWDMNTARRWYENWVLETPLSKCLEQIKVYTTKQTTYYNICMDILKHFHGDIMESPLYKAMQELEEDHS